jgi:hypothetical protein
VYGLNRFAHDPLAPTAIGGDPASADLADLVERAQAGDHDAFAGRDAIAIPRSDLGELRVYQLETRPG